MDLPIESSHTHWSVVEFLPPELLCCYSAIQYELQRWYSSV
jgi:hypothetical protein